ncbi:MAG: hypothetical protein GF383_05095 [Candidatus Lokiarchaeota archaeon]|nr:hypothetical protein [Candidatus Lokiarchaeota archaeon]MBD3339266.1 hypothetical protein [Candidatus Lokiarchaeota archaeon]
MKKQKKTELDQNLKQNLDIVKKILNNVAEIISLLKPLIIKASQLEEAEKYKKDGTFQKASDLFGDISHQCKKLRHTSIHQKLPLSKEFLENLKN